MTTDSSATVRTEAPQANQTRTNTIINALKRRAQATFFSEIALRDNTNHYLLLTGLQNGQDGLFQAQFC